MNVSRFLIQGRRLRVAYRVHRADYRKGGGAAFSCEVTDNPTFEAVRCLFLLSGLLRGLSPKLEEAVFSGWFASRIEAGTFVVASRTMRCCAKGGFDGFE